MTWGIPSVEPQGIEGEDEGVQRPLEAHWVAFHLRGSQFSSSFDKCEGRGEGEWGTCLLGRGVWGLE